MTVYNGDDYLIESIDSILLQTYRNFEFLIVNDGSTDRTGKILERYRDPRLRIITNQKNLGQTKSLNIGLREAHGRYIARQDADDFSLPERLAKQLQVFEKDSSISLVACWADFINQNEHFIGWWQADRQSNTPEEIYSRLIFHNCLVHSSVMFDKQLVLRLGGYDESFATSQDFELWTRIAQVAKISKIKEALAVRRERPENKLQKIEEAYLFFEKKIFLRNLKPLVPPEYTPEILLHLKYDDQELYPRKTSIISKWLYFRHLNQSIVKSKPEFLDAVKIKRALAKKRRLVLYRSLFRPLVKLTRSTQASISSPESPFDLDLSLLWLYQQRFISFRQLGNDFLQSILNRYQNEEKGTARIVLLQILSAFRLSLHLGIIFLSTLALAILRKGLSFPARFINEYLHFLVTFKSNVQSLKTNKAGGNLLVVTPSLVVGGAEKSLLQLSKALRNQKINLHLLTTYPAKHVWLASFSAYFKNLIIPVNKIPADFICWQYLKAIIRKLDIKLMLISNSATAYRWLPRLKKTFPDLKTVDLLHVEESCGATPELRGLIPYLDKRICISSHLQEYLKRQYRQNYLAKRYQARIKFIPNCLDHKNYRRELFSEGEFKKKHQLPADCKLIAFIGRLTVMKNPGLFLKIARHILASLPQQQIKFVIAGDGPLLPQIRSGIKRMGLAPYILLPGIIDDTRALLADTDILLLTSLNEGIPFVTLEAMAMEVPVISTRVGAIGEVIKDNINGYLIDPKDNIEEEFVDRVKRVLSDKTHQRQLVRKARQTITTSYSLKTMAKKYQSLFKPLLN